MLPKVRSGPVFTKLEIPPGLEIRRDHPLTVTAKDDDAFINAISPVTGFGAKLSLRKLIYRGQASSEWPLIPRARRANAWPPVGRTWEGNDLLGRIHAEVVGLLNFCHVADLQGLPIPHLSTLRNTLPMYSVALIHGKHQLIELWPPDDAAPALALAQHSGLPTCLLDFTRNPFVASYFAARGALENEKNRDEPRELCVWIVADPTWTATHDTLARGKIVVPPASDNLSLQRQEGLFAYCPRKIESVEKLGGEYVPDEPLECVFEDQSPGSVVQVNVSTSFANMVLQKTIKMGYDASRLFPTYEGVVRGLRDLDLAPNGSDVHVGSQLLKWPKTPAV